MFKSVIASYSRSPFTIAKKGELTDVKPDELISEVIKNLIIKSKINKEFLDFEIFYETSQCVNKKNEHGFLAHQGGGGRMVKKDDNSIIFTTGEFRNRPLAQDVNSEFGKILNIEVEGPNGVPSSSAP